MSRWIYEQDLVTQKYRILITVRHDRIVRQIAADLGMGLQELRRYLIGRWDMILLENLPARFEAAADIDKGGDPVAQAIGRDLYTKAIPLVPADVMEKAYRSALASVQAGSPLPEAAAGAKAMLREAMMR